MLVATQKQYLMAIFFLIVFCVGSAQAAGKNSSISMFCPLDGIKGQTILLIDTTDPLPQQAQERLKQLLMGLMDSENTHYIKPGNELVVYHLTPQSNRVSKPSLRICNPGNPADRTFRDNLTGSQVESQRKWNYFAARIRRDAFRQINRQVAENSSPLLELLSWASARHIPRLGVTKEKQKSNRLILFSDMLQNSLHMSHYRSLPTMEEFKALDGYLEMSSDLRGVDVWLFYVRRPGLADKQTKKHYYWWAKVIDFFGGKVIEQVPL